MMHTFTVVNLLLPNVYTGIRFLEVLCTDIKFNLLTSFIPNFSLSFVKVV